MPYVNADGSRCESGDWARVVLEQVDWAGDFDMVHGFAEDSARLAIWLSQQGVSPLRSAGVASQLLCKAERVREVLTAMANGEEDECGGPHGIYEAMRRMCGTFPNGPGLVDVIENEEPGLITLRSNTGNEYLI